MAWAVFCTSKFWIFFSGVCFMETFWYGWELSIWAKDLNWILEGWYETLQCYVEFEYRPKKPLKHEKYVSNFLSHGPDIRKSIAFFENSNDLPIFPSDNSSIKMKISVEHWRNDIDRGKPEALGEKPVPVPIYSQKIYVVSPGIEPQPPRWGTDE